jgi:hypothetical protein
LAHATAAYRLNPEMHEILGAGLIRLIVRGENVIGHYGRRGYISGALHGRVLTATLRDGVHEGEMRLTFDKEFTRFEGSYLAGLANGPSEQPCFGTRITRRRSLA